MFGIEFPAKTAGQAAGFALAVLVVIAVVMRVGALRKLAAA